VKPGTLHVLMNNQDLEERFAFFSFFRFG
jgi:hypothetical protein